jgi:hypothetical protein
MHRIAVTLTNALGVVAIVLMLLWGLLSMALYGSPFGGLRGAELAGLLVALLLGPFSILPAGLVGRKRPGIAGGWLLALGIVSFVVILPRRAQGYDVILPLVLVTAPLMSLGAAFTKVWFDRRGGT